MSDLVKVITRWKDSLMFSIPECNVRNEFTCQSEESFSMWMEEFKRMECKVSLKNSSFLMIIISSTTILFPF